jgi:molecular chaperone DnaK
MSRILGIDLGTTNSCVAVVDVTRPQVISNREGSRTTPSVVGFTEDGERLVGQIAKRQGITNPFNTVFAIKRLIGRKYDSDEVSRAKAVLPYQIVSSANGDMKVKVREREYSPEEISAFVLGEIKAFTEEYLGEEITEAVITVPAYFNDSQRQATRDAGRIAGLEVLRIINEPTAAALAYGLDNQATQRIAVYDLGGGTFDISILKIEDGLFEVSPRLETRTWEARISTGGSWTGCSKDSRHDTGIDLSEDRMALQRLKEASEKAKQELSLSEETKITLPFISADAAGPKHLNRVLGREQFEAMVDDLIQRTIDPVRDALKEAGLEASDIDEVVLVGGQTRMPKVIEAVPERVRAGAQPQHQP